MITARPYQIAGLRAAADARRRGIRRILLVLPTGGGKTILAAYISASVLSRGGRLIFVAHRRELIKQCFAKLVRNGIDPRQIGVIMGGTSGKLVDAIAGDPSTLSDSDLWERWARRRPGAPLQVASIDTLRGRAKTPADTIIIDEAHRALCKSYLDLVDLYPEATVFGLTATPYRADNRGLGELFEELIQVATYSQLIADGWILDPEMYSSDAPDTSGVRVKSSGDYDERELAEVVDKATLVGDIVAHWKERLFGIRTACFAVSIAHSRHIVERFVAEGIRAEHLDANTHVAERDAILRRLDSGETLVVSNVDVLTEGWDMPSVKGAILARPTLSERVYRQQGGRILRPWQGQGAIIHDHAGLYARFGRVTEDRDHSLDSPRRRKKAVAAAPVTLCESCFAPIPCVCGAEPSAVGEGRAMPEEADGRLTLVERTTTDERRAFWEALCASRGANGPGWVFIRFLKRFGTKPPRGWEVPLSEDERQAMDLEDAPKKARLRELYAEAQSKGWKPGAVMMRFKLEHGFFPPSQWNAECKPKAADLFAGIEMSA